MGQKRRRSLIQECLVGRAAALGDKQELVGVLAFLIDVDLGGKVVAGVLFLEHRDRGELRIAQVTLLVGIHHAACERFIIATPGPYAATFFRHDDGSAGILAHGQNTACRNIGVLQEIEGNEAVVFGGFGVFQNGTQLGQVSWPQQMVDVTKGRFGQHPECCRVHGQDFLALKGLDARKIAIQLAPGGFILCEGEKIAGHWICLSCHRCRVLAGSSGCEPPRQLRP